MCWWLCWSCGGGIGDCVGGGVSDCVGKGISDYVSDGMRSVIWIYWGVGVGTRMCVGIVVGIG